MRLRYLVAVVIALVFTFLVVHGEEVGSDDSVGRAVVLVIDNSPSMNIIDPDYTRFNETKRLILRDSSIYKIGILTYMDKNTPRQITPTSIVCFENKLNCILNMVRNTTITPNDMDLTSCLKKASYMLDDEKNRSIIFISDGTILMGFHERYRFEIDDPKPENEDNLRVRELKNTLKDLKDKNIAIHTIYIGYDPDGKKLLHNMSMYTNGTHISLPPPFPNNFKPGIEVNKTAYPKEGVPSTKVTFLINVTNNGEVNFTEVEVMDVLPYGLSYVSHNRSGSVDGQNVTCNLSGLNVSESKFIELVAQINGSKFGNLTNNITVTGVLRIGDIVTNSSSAVVIAENSSIVNKTDLVFALDTSGSMKKYYRMAPNEGAEIVSELSSFGNVNISIVSWDHRSELIFGPAPLKGDETHVAEVLDNLSELCIETDLTYYDQGLNGSLAVMRDQAAESAASEKIIVFLTGFSEFELGEKLDDYVSEANESGYRIFTIGIGINSSFNASQKQYQNLTMISEGTDGIFYNVTAFSSEKLNPVIENITRVAEIDRRSKDSGT